MTGPKITKCDERARLAKPEPCEHLELIAGSKGIECKDCGHKFSLEESQELLSQARSEWRVITPDAPTTSSTAEQREDLGALADLLVDMGATEDAKADPIGAAIQILHAYRETGPWPGKPVPCLGDDNPKECDCCSDIGQAYCDCSCHGTCKPESEG